MPVARIFTTHPERTEALSRQLQSQGYTVEVLAPNAAVSRPAELEIDFEIWPEEAALDRAAELAEELHADVAVDPGVGLNPQDVPPQSMPQPVLESPAPPQPVQPVAQSAPLPPVELVQPLSEAVEQLPIQSTAQEAPAEPLLPPRQASGLGHVPEAESSYFGLEHNEASAPATEDARDPHVPRAGLAAELWTTARQMIREGAERSRIYLAERNVRREDKLLVLTERKALAQERANELQEARRVASARLEELVRMGGTEPLPASTHQLEVEAEHVYTSASAFTHAREQVNEWWRKLLGRRYSPQVQAILTGVAAIMALFVLAMAIASLRPRPALSNSLDTSYKGVTVKTGGATVTTPPAPAKSPATRPSPVVVRTAPNTGKQSPAHRAGGDAVPQSDSGDVTVRRLKAQAPAPKPAAKNTPQTGMKRISDLDN